MSISGLKQQNIKRERRARRVRSKLLGTAERPRLCVSRSNRFLRAQLIDDVSQVTLGSSTSQNAPKGISPAEFVGTDIAKQAAKKKIKAVVFDRGSLIYTGNVQKLAEAARASGLIF